MVTLNGLFPGPRPSKEQLDIIGIFNVVETLQQRGFQDVREESIDCTLLTPNGYRNFGQRTREDQLEAINFLKRFNLKEYRIHMRGIIFDGAEPDSSNEFEVAVRKTRDKELRYGMTVELLLAYLCIKELRAFSASFGIHIGGTPEGGDYDCIANFQNALYHYEVKSGNTRNVTKDDLQTILLRHDYLAPEATILFFDYQGISDNIIKKFRGLRINNIHRVTDIYKVKTEAGSLFAIWPGVVAVDLSKSGDILKNLRAAMRYLERYKAQTRAFFAAHIDPCALGYKPEPI